MSDSDMPEYINHDKIYAAPDLTDPTGTVGSWATFRLGDFESLYLRASPIAARAGELLKAFDADHSRYGPHQQRVTVLETDFDAMYAFLQQLSESAKGNEG